MFTNDPTTTTGWTTHISNPLIRTGSLIRVSNDIFGGGGPYVYSTTDYCSIHVPGNAQAIVAVTEFDTTSASPDCQQSLRLTQWNSSQTFELCRWASIGLAYTSYTVEFLDRIIIGSDRRLESKQGIDGKLLGSDQEGLGIGLWIGLGLGIRIADLNQIDPIWSYQFWRLLNLNRRSEPNTVLLDQELIPYRYSSWYSSCSCACCWGAQWRSVGNRRPARTAILASQKVVRCMMPLYH